MPKRTDIHKILIIGSGPIVIGQACEFDYSGTQACKALREEGYEVVLVNSNPATIMTDPEMADRTYIEPITWEVVEQIIAVENARRPAADARRPDRAQRRPWTSHEHGVLEQYGVRDDRRQRRGHRQGRGPGAVQAVHGGDRPGACPAAALAHNLDEARRIRDEVGLPCVLRPSFTLGGTGGGIAYNREEFDRMVAHGARAQPGRTRS